MKIVLKNKKSNFITYTLMNLILYKSKFYNDLLFFVSMINKEKNKII